MFQYLATTICVRTEKTGSSFSTLYWIATSLFTGSILGEKTKKKKGVLQRENEIVRGKWPRTRQWCGEDIGVRVEVPEGWAWYSGGSVVKLLINFPFGGGEFSLPLPPPTAAAVFTHAHTAGWKFSVRTATRGPGRTLWSTAKWERVRDSSTSSSSTVKTHTVDLEHTHVRQREWTRGLHTISSYKGASANTLTLSYPLCCSWFFTFLPFQGF